MTDDVRVKLSSEGVAEVVNAFKTMSSEGKKAAHDTEGAFDEFGDQIKDIGKELVGFVAIGALFEGVKESIKGVFENAEVVQNFAKATGLSTDAIQGLQSAAKDAGVSMDTVSSAVNKLTINVGKAKSGVSTALAPFDQLKIKFADFEKLSPDQQFETIAKALAGVENPAQRAAIGAQLFGKQFQDLVPLLDDVNERGLQSYIDHLKEIGVLMDSGTVASLKNVGDQLLEIKQRATGMTTQFLTGFVPALEQGTDGFLKAANDGADGLKTVGDGVGTLFKGLVFVAVVVGKTIGDVIGAAVQTTMGYINATRSALENLAKGDFSKAGDSFKQGFVQNGAQLKQLFADVKRDASDAVDSIFGDDKPKEGPKNAATATDVDANVANLKALGQARYQLVSAQLDSELALYEAHAKLQLDQETQEYQAGKESLTQYYADRARIISEQFDQEIATLRKKQAAAAAVPISENDPAAALQRQAQDAQIAGQIQLKQLQQQQALVANTNEERQAQRQLYSDQLTAEARLATLQGRRFDASKANLEIQLQQLDDVLKKGGVADDARQSALDAARAQGTALANFTEQAAAGDAALRGLNTGIASIQNDVANGSKFQLQGEQDIIALEKERLPTLQKIADAMVAAATASKDPQALAQAQAYQQKLKEIATSTNTAGQAMAQFKAGAQGAFADGLYDFLDTGIQKVHSLGEAFKGLVTSILDGIKKVLLQIAVEKAAKAIFGGGSTPSTASALGNVFSGGHVVKAFAQGGAFSNSIASRPTLAPMALFGESGPEAIMPLTRDSTGKLGVRAGGAGGAMSFAIEVNIDNNGASSQVKQSAQDDAGNQLGQLIQQKCTEELTRQMRPGGLIWKMKNGG